jgi:HSP20 family protein
MYNRSNYSHAPLHLAHFLESFISKEPGFNETRNYGTASVNIREDEHKYELLLVAPGLQKEDFKIGIDKNTLSIGYELKEENKDARDKWLRQEFRMKSFKRSFALNDKIDVAGIQAQYEQGVLRVELPKKEKEEPQTVSISVQ